jgi:RNA 2',3'-cyclic 3'-phosphodiesterase
MQDDRRATIRVFFALWPDDDLRAALLGARDGAALEHARIIHPNDLHLTLVFVGDVAPERLECIEAAGDDVALGCFELALRRAESWPRQRLLVAVPDAAPPPLCELVSQLQQNLLACGVEPEPRRFRPHVTLARRAARAAQQPLTIDWPVRRFVLARSALGGGGGGYQLLRSWPLEGW